MALRLPDVGWHSPLAVVAREASVAVPHLVGIQGHRTRHRYARMRDCGVRNAHRAPTSRRRAAGLFLSKAVALFCSKRQRGPHPFVTAEGRARADPPASSIPSVRRWRSPSWVGCTIDTYECEFPTRTSVWRVRPGTTCNLSHWNQSIELLLPKGTIGSDKLFELIKYDNPSF
jgi:hypothetical protein